ncbi:MAG: TonB-dependent receptor, partial [Thermoanaerobaculia bacterium]|nr:TonB-dependent receptor [Thermoanaerobaculia bacterium]
DVDGFGPVDDPNAIQDRRGWVGTLAATLPINDVWTQTVSVGVFDEALTGEDPDTFFNNFEINTRTTEIATQARLALGESKVLLGASNEERDAEVTGFGYDDSVDLTALYAQYQRGWGDRLVVTLGARWDDHSEFGGETTWRGTLSYAWAAQTRLHASFGTGFRAPALNELFFPFFGNPDLDPERSEGFDLGVERRFLDGRLSADLTFFSNDFDDLIGVDENFIAVNIDRARSRGLELTLDYRVSERFQLGFSHTWDDTEDRSTGAQLARRPEHRTTLDLHFEPIPALDATLTAISVRDRVDTGGRALEDYVRVDLGLSYALSHGVEPYLRIENLFDEDYEEIFGFGTPGFTLALGARWAWGAGR